jgi:hypothetical protein
LIDIQPANESMAIPATTKHDQTRLSSSTHVDDDATHTPTVATTVAIEASTKPSSLSSSLLSPSSDDAPLPIKRVIILCIINLNEGFQANLIW